MNKEEVEAVLAHEIAHVANGDMVTMTLIQGVTNTFVVSCLVSSATLWIAAFSAMRMMLLVSVTT